MSDAQDAVRARVVFERWIANGPLLDLGRRLDPQLSETDRYISSDTQRAFVTWLAGWRAASDQKEAGL